jgi:outer membrane protein insertion porin family
LLKKYYFLLITLLLAVLDLNAARIDRIDIKSKSGNEVSRSSVLARMILKEGKEFSNEILSKDLKSLMGSGLFEDVNCEVSPSDSKDKVILTIEVVLLPEIRRIIFMGNNEFEDEDLEDEVKLEAGSRLVYKTLAADKKAILDLYEDKSYFGTTVTFKAADIENDNRIDLIWQIKEHPRYKVGAISFKGNSNIDEDDLEDEIVTEKSWLSYLFPTGYLNPLSLEEDKRRIVNLYKEHGFLDIKVTSITTTPNDNRIDIAYTVKEGPKYIISDVKIEGNENYTIPELLARTLKQKKWTAEKLFAELPLRAGEVYSSSTESMVVESIKSVYYYDGYIDLSCYPKHIKKDGKVSIIIKIRENSKSKINNIYISGNRKTQDRVIRRELSLIPGDVANKRKIESSKRRLENLNYFDSVTITPTNTTKDDEKDLRIALKEKNTGQFNVGLGFSTEDSVTASVEVSQSNFDLFNWPYFLGAGQKMRSRVQIGSERTEVLLSLTEPWLFNRRLSLSGSGYVKEREYDEYTQETIGTAWSLTRKMDRKFWRQTFGFSFEKIKISDLEEPITPEFQKEKGKYWSNQLYVQFKRDSTDRYQFPTRGSKLTSRLGGQSEIIGSYTNSVNIDLTYDKYILVNKERGWVLKLGFKLRQIDKISGDDIAIFDRYFAGGPGTLRGFEFRDVGPVDANKNPYGGQSLLCGTAQLRFPLMDSLHFIVFTDMGNVWEDEWEYRLDEINVSVGVGFRIILPIAPISVDYGFPVHTDQKHLEDENGKLHFNLGFSY